MKKTFFFKNRFLILLAFLRLLYLQRFEHVNCITWRARKETPNLYERIGETFIIADSTLVERIRLHKEYPLLAQHIYGLFKMRNHAYRTQMLSCDPADRSFYVSIEII